VQKRCVSPFLRGFAQREGDSPIRGELDLFVSKRRAQPVSKEALSSFAIALFNAQVGMKR
jgi:hypothetical protein